MNLATVVTGLVVLAIVCLAVRSLIKEKKNGGCGCGCTSCTGACPHCGTQIKERGTN